MVLSSGFIPSGQNSAVMVFLLRFFFPLVILVLCGMDSPQQPKWTSLLDENLSAWETYLSYRHQPGYNGKVPLDENGRDIPPVGYNRDSTGVFTVERQRGELVLRVSGEIYGCLFTKNDFDNYHLTLKVKWGEKKYIPRTDKLRDSGILYHSIGEAGAEYWRSWMLSQEFQIMEGHMGDYWSQASSAIDIRSFLPEGRMNCVADARQPFLPFGAGSTEGYCMRSENRESDHGAWTTLELVCHEGRSLHIVNGKVVMVLRNSRYVKDGKGVPLTKGKIQLQSEAAEVFFKDIRIRELKELSREHAAFFE
jgi:hypothetical protein